MLSIKEKINTEKARDSDYAIFSGLVDKIKRQSEPIQTRLEEIQLRFARKNNFILTGKEK